MATLRPDRRAAHATPELLVAVLLGLAVGLSIGGQWRPLYAVLVFLTGG